MIKDLEYGWWNRINLLFDWSIDARWILDAQTRITKLDGSLWSLQVKFFRGIVRKFQGHDTELIRNRCAVFFKINVDQMSYEKVEFQIRKDAHSQNFGSI